MAIPKFQYAALTDVGVKRSHNQDAVAALPAADDANWKTVGHVFIVADGMGGHAVGEKASAKAVRDIPLTYSKHVAADGPRTAVRRAFVEANAGIFEIGQKNPEFQGMGTTGTALFVRPDGAWVGHVGDSRAYRVRRGKVEQLTFDHSWVWEIARRQGIDPDELGDFKKNVIIRSLGPDSEVEVDIEGPYPVEPGDVFLLCSDGLSNQVTGDEIGAVASTLPPEDACKFLIALANVRGGPDNITALIVQAPGKPEDTAGGVAAPGRGPRGGFLRRALVRWDQFVPWSYTFLALGSACVVASLLVHSPGSMAALPLFVAAAALIILGVVGLILHLKKTPPNPDDAPPADGGLNVYKTYPYAVDKPIHDRFAEAEEAMLAGLKEKNAPLDWPAYQKLADEATLRLGKAEYTAAFRARCLAFGLLAAGQTKDRNKEEAFQPNWTTPSRA